MDLYLKVRRAHFQDGLSGRKIARDFGISRDSVAKNLAYSEPPGYRRATPIRRPKLGAFTEQIDQWLAEDKARPRKQRHTAKRILSGFGTSAGLMAVTLSSRITFGPKGDPARRCSCRSVIRLVMPRRTLAKRLW